VKKGFIEMPEIEAKFYLRDLPALRARIEAQGAELEAPRVHEVNLRFDTPEGGLKAVGQVLRLRSDSRARMTYKGPAAPGEEVAVRTEIEFEVNDFEAARALLEALGYEVFVMYEKFRTTYTLGGTEVTLDEMPFGYFCEIEGPDAETIRGVAQSLGLDWSTRINISYLELFERLKTNRRLEARHLSFAELQGPAYDAQDFDVRAADMPDLPGQPYPADGTG
jgi:adenylate cyclase class 2